MASGTSSAIVGSVVLIREGDDFVGGLVVEEGRKGLVVEGVDGHRHKATGSQLLVVENGPLARKVPQDFVADVREALSRIDLRVAWELLVDEEEALLELQELQALCADAHSPVDRAALLVALELGETWFKRKGDRYAPLSAKAVAERDEQRQRALAKEAAQAAQVSDLRRLAAGTPVAELTDEGRAALLAIQQCAIAQEATPAAAKLLGELLPEDDRPAHVVGFEWLQQVGVFHEHEDLMVRKLDLQEAFPEPVIANALELAAALPDRLASRPLLEGIDWIAIDDAETVEVDDALGVERLPDGGSRIHVAICDVAAAVPRNCAVDIEAADRGTTVYHPVTRYLMMPPVLAENALSLVVGQERLVLDHIFSVDARGGVYDFAVKPVRIALSRRLTYEAADEEIARDSDGDLAWLWQIAEKLFNERVIQGAMHFYPVEVKIRVDDGVVSRTPIDNYSVSRRLVSEFMVACGGAVGRMLAEQMVPAIYRRQVAPSDPVEWDEESARDPVYILDQVRKLKRAEISLQPDRHHALGLMAYCQVTSPLRRYGDLLMQRQLHSFLVRRVAEYGDGELLKLMTVADQAALQVRRVVAQAERYWSLVDLSRREGESVAAVVLSDQPRRELVLLLDYGLQSKFFPRRPVRAGEPLSLKVVRAVPRTDTLVLAEG